MGRVTARNAVLRSATDYVVADLKGTKVTTTADGTPLSEAKNTTQPKRQGMSVGGWICIGLCILLGIWLVIGLIRAFTSPAYYGGPGYGGGGGWG